jgi:hypothetical protein
MIKIDYQCNECGKDFIYIGDRWSRFYGRNHFCSIECKNLFHKKLMKIKNPMQGKHHSEKVKEFIRKLNTGRKPTIEQRRNKILAMIGKKHTIEWNINISEGNMGKSRGCGEKNNNWKGGTSSEIRKRYMRHDWKLIRKEILIRYNFKCLDCGKIGSLDIHHVIPYRIVKEHNVDNLVPLCKSCHQKREWKTNIQKGGGR